MVLRAQRSRSTKTNGTMKIHGGTFTSTKCGQVLGNKAHVTIDGTPEFNSVGGTADAIVNVDAGKMQFNNGIIKVSDKSAVQHFVQTALPKQKSTVVQL